MGHTNITPVVHVGEEWEHTLKLHTVWQARSVAMPEWIDHAQGASPPPPPIHTLGTSQRDLPPHLYGPHIA